MTEQVKEQILKVRNTGLTNMFDILMVQVIAQNLGFDELSQYIEDGNRKEYSQFILTGEY